MRDKLKNKLFIGDIVYDGDTFYIIESAKTVREYREVFDMWVSLNITSLASVVLIPWAIFNDRNLRSIYVEEAKRIKKLA